MKWGGGYIWTILSGILTVNEKRGDVFVGTREIGNGRGRGLLGRQIEKVAIGSGATDRNKSLTSAKEVEFCLQKQT